MTHHLWGDEWFEKNGKDLNKAIDYLSDFCHRWGRLGGGIKEKFGTIRFAVRFHCMLHDLFYPGHFFIRWNEFFNWLDMNIYCSFIFKPIRFLICKWQEFIFRKAYKRTAKKWPHLKAEIYSDADVHELLQKDYPFYRTRLDMDDPIDDVLVSLIHNGEDMNPSEFKKAVIVSLKEILLQIKKNNLLK